MFRVLECVWLQHDRLVVGLAALIWIVGSLAFFLSLARSRECSESRRNSWTAISAAVGGLGVWATHFVAMLAYEGSMPIAYDLGPTLLSAGLAVIGFWLALRVLGTAETPRCIVAGVMMAVSVGLMHFVGMAGVRAGATLSYDWGVVLVAFALTAVLFVAALISFSRLKGWRKVAIPAVLSIVAVCALHFSGMSATTLTPDPTLPSPQGGLGHRWLIGGIIVVANLIIGLTAISVLIDRYLTDLRGFAGATLEGLAIVRDDRIIEVNALFAGMMRRSQLELIGRSPDDFLLPVDGLAAAVSREVSVEAAGLGAGEGRVLEVASHTIEYRGRPCQVLAVRDLTDKKNDQRKIEHLARHDPLTDLPNRLLLQDRMEQALYRAQRSGEGIAVLALDLDRFKAVNDIFGHAEGDRILRRVADILRDSVRTTDTVARIGGDEFVIVQVGAVQPEGAETLSQRILESFAECMNVSLDPTAVGVSIGVALCPEDGNDAESLRQAADIALYRAKAAGRGVACFHDISMDQEVHTRRRMEADLRNAIARNELSVVYQPLVTTGDGECSGYEALCRWDHPEHGPVAPDVFIPLAEDSGSILPIGEWVLRQACRSATTWDAGLSLAVNVSPVQLRVPALADMILSVLVETGLAPQRLELEITETALLKDREVVLTSLLRLKAAGVRVVMDDFGTGYSSLSNLQSFPFDKIKIDRSFIGTMEDDEAARSIVRAIVGIGRSLNLPVVAEGVETESQHRMVRDEGCPQAQGYFFGRPGAAPILSSGKGVEAA